MRRKQKMLSVLLVFSMVMSLFTGQYTMKTEVNAAVENEIVLGDSTKSEGYYTYPNAEIKLKQEDQKLYHLSVSVDSGFITTDMTEIAGAKGKGILYSAESVDQEYIVAGNQYDTLTFDITDGASKSEIEGIIRNLKFTTEEDQVQKVSVSATSINDEKVTINGTEYKLAYYDGHFYGYITAGMNWNKAYQEARSATFAGMEGYLLTLTSNGEDRFVWATFAAKQGWMGCTRATAKDNQYDGDGVGDDFWTLDSFDTENVENNIWRWACGPEAGQAFGYQNDAYQWSGGPSNDGGFVTYDGWFSNWRNSGNIEPNGGYKGGLLEPEGYGYYAVVSNGSWNDHPNSEYKSYYIEFGGRDGDIEKAEDAGIVIVTEEKNSDGTVPAVSPKPTTTPEADEKQITGKPAIVPDDPDVRRGTTLTADISGVGPEAAKDSLAYQWYIKEDDGTLTPIDGATNQNYVVKSATEGKTYVVEVAGTGEYKGAAKSDPLTPISGIVPINNKDKDEKGNDVVKVGTVLSAGIYGVDPAGSHDTLTYQWYIKVDDESLVAIPDAVYPNYVVTEDTLNKDLVVAVSGNGKYYGEIISDPYDTTRTSADITIGGDEEEDTPDGKRTITIKPTDDSTIYALKDESGNVVIVPTVDGDGNPLTPDVDDYEGYYQGTEDGVIKFTELDKDKTYIIHEIKIKKDSDNKDIVSPSIPDSDIKTEYDDKGTADQADDTTTIIVDPALEDSVYAVLKKEKDGSYTEVSVTKDADGNYTSDPNSVAVWSDGGEKVVKFTGLEPGGTYKVVAKSSDGTIKDVTPDSMTGGSKDITTPSDPPASVPTPTPSGQPTNPGTSAQPGVSSQPSSNPVVIFTKAEEDAATKFIKQYGTDPKGKIITNVTDLTRDIIVSGEGDWKKLTDREKQAVNAKLKAAGSKYTYEQLLKMAKSYKIPGFKVIKFMKKKTKAKLKLVKCSGATIVCTSTNKKVATVNKKGVITAKKPGRATLTFTAIKGKYTNRLVIDVRVKKKFKNAKELTNFKSKVIKTPTVLIAKKRLLKKSSKIQVYDLLKSSKVKFTPIKKNILTINKKGKYTGKKKGSTLVKVEIKQNDKTYLLYVYVTIY